MPSSKTLHNGIEKDLHVALVYQNGIANVFVRAGEGTDAGKWVRVLQDCYGYCEMFALGMRTAGALLTVMHCDESGDITEKDWQLGRGPLWSDRKRSI